METQLQENESEAVQRESTLQQSQKLGKNQVASLAAKIAAEEIIQSLRDEKVQLESEH